MTDINSTFILNNDEALKMPSNIMFHVQEHEEPILKLCENGDIFVKGKKVINDLEVVEGMRELLKLNGITK